MGRITKPLIIYVLAIVLLDIAVGYFLFKSRLFSHLAVWNIIESSKEEDFYWKPEKAPRYFYFGPKESDTLIFRNEILPLIGNENKEFNIMLKVARYTIDINTANRRPGLSLKWDSPEGMLRQIRDGRTANCFHRAVLFSTYLSSIGIKSRLWALENNRFDNTAHTITEAYIKDFKKWVFIDTMFGFYVIEDGEPLSLLELRKRLLDNGDRQIFATRIQNENKKQEKPPDRYKKLIRCVFLRSGNDFVNKYNFRYGILSIFQRQIDKLPDDIRRGLDYLLGRRDVFIHYVDKYSSALRPMTITAKLAFWFLIFSPLLIALILVKNLSKKDTFHI